MNKQENEKRMMVPPAENKGTIMLPPNEMGLMTPPTPMNRSDMLEVSGGTDENQTPGIDLDKPPEMKVVELKDGTFVNVPECAICKTEEEAKKFVMPKPKKSENKHHHRHSSHHHKINPIKPWL